MNEALNRSSVFVPTVLNMSLRSENMDRTVLSFFLSSCSERSEVGGCMQRSPWRAQSRACAFEGSVAFDALKESMLKCLDVNAVGYRVKGGRFAHDERAVMTAHRREQPSCVELIETPGSRFSPRVLLTPRTMTRAQTNVSRLRNPGREVTQSDLRKAQDMTPSHACCWSRCILEITPTLQQDEESKQAVVWKEMASRRDNTVQSQHPRTRSLRIPDRKSVV